MASLLAGAPVPGMSQDRITVRDERSNKLSTFEAQVLQWDARRLTYNAAGRENSIPAPRIATVEYSKTEQHQQAERLFREGRLLQAWQSYDLAINDEPREWVRQEMLARQLRCAAALGRQAEALQAFFAILKATRQSRHFHLIPIPWDRSRPDPSMAAGYQGWLANPDEVLRLVAASWLLMADEEQAVTALRELSASSDSRVAHLATAQLWRTGSISAGPADLNRWRAAVRRMPEQLQAGPRYQIALVLKRQAQVSQAAETGPGDLEEAVVALLQIPVLFPEQYQLAGQALVQAHQLLEAAGRHEEAARVLAELKRDFAFSAAALKMGARIENLDQ